MALNNRVNTISYISVLAQIKDRPTKKAIIINPAFAEHSSRGESRPTLETPHGCRHAFQSERAAAAIDSARRKSVPLPIAVALVFRLNRAECIEHAILAGLPFASYRRARNQDGSAVVFVR